MEKFPTKRNAEVVFGGKWEENRWMDGGIATGKLGLVLERKGKHPYPEFFDERYALKGKMDASW